MFEKSNITKRAQINQKDLLFTSSGKYFGGISTKMINKPEEGCIGLTKDELIFVNLAFLKRNYIIIKIPLKDILKDKVKQENARDINKENSMTAASYFAGYGPISTYKFDILLVKVPFKRDGKIQEPAFFIKDIKGFSEILHKLV